MRVKYTTATGCPNGQFVIYAENDEEREVLHYFLSANPKVWQFWLHGWTKEGFVNGTSSFNFGWIRKSKLKKRFTMSQRAKTLIVVVFILFLGGVLVMSLGRIPVP